MTTNADQPREESSAPPRPATIVPRSPASPVASPVDHADELRPGSANDTRNHSKRDPMHISAGTAGKDPPP